MKRKAIVIMLVLAALLVQSCGKSNGNKDTEAQLTENQDIVTPDLKTTSFPSNSITLSPTSSPEPT